jgi:acyl-CoA reductase-like NAD-dependent aldehyde dehydrogenase
MITSVSPQSPGDVVAQVRPSDPAEVAAAADAARSAALEWQRLPANARANALNAAADRLQAAGEMHATAIVREVGKPRREAAAEAARGVGIMRYFAQQCLGAVGDVLPGPAPGAQVLTRRRARGVAGLITPWNFPVAIPVWKIAPALACGNAVLWKPSSAAVGIASELAALLAAELPAGLLAVVPGEAETAEAVIDNADVVSFTGSTAVGRSVVTRCAARNITCQAEMGGSNYAVVMPSADPTAAAAQIAAAAFSYAGQKCTATSHVLVVGDAEPVEKALAAAMAALVIGDPDDPGTDSGPLIDAAAAARCAQAWREARDGGARLVFEAGDRVDGAWQPLRLVADVPDGARLRREEVFGPIATIAAVPSLEEAIDAVNSSRYGLVSGLHTTVLSDVWTFCQDVRSGMVKVNVPTTGVDYWAPFGGDKDSSFGPREQGSAAMQFYSTTQTTTIGPA